MSFFSVSIQITKITSNMWLLFSESSGPELSPLLLFINVHTLLEYSQNTC